MNANRWLWAVSCGLWVGAALAADPPAPANTPAPTTTPAPVTTPAPAKPADPKAADAKAPAAQKPAGDTKAPTKDPNTPSTPQRFVPSEQVRPDFDVSFPVDI